MPKEQRASYDGSYVTEEVEIYGGGGGEMQYQVHSYELKTFN